MLKDILVIIEVFPFGLFRTDNLVANLYGICLEEKSIFSTAFSGAIVVGLSEIAVPSIRHIGPSHSSSFN